MQIEELGRELAGRSPEEKIALLDSLEDGKAFFQKHPELWNVFERLSIENQVLFKQLIAIKQASRLFYGELCESSLSSLFEKLSAIDYFYREIGGLVGYQAKVLKLLQEKKESFPKAIYHAPFFFDISEEAREATEWGVEALPEMAEIYPLGGAADRLHLVDETSGMELPAANLPFAGKTLLEHLISDLQAREFLFYQKFGIQLVTPIAMMTSLEKNNHERVLQICEENRWFGRPRDSFRFFTQPLVPAVSENGDWCVLGAMKPLFKPGGHGAIWKLAKDSGIFNWLRGLGRKKALIRQINNPIAGLDYGLLAFTGLGWKKEMLFGFASCPRLLQAAEGINVLVEKESQLVLTNIEYCDFTKFGIEDAPLREGEPYSRFSSNTNILFADLEALDKAVDAMPLPGLLINLKKTNYTLENGEKREEIIARLESTMQNIADVFVEKKQSELKTENTYLTYNRRHKTISTAKRAYVQGKSLQETPENCFYDLLTAHRELLQESGFFLPPKRSLEEYLTKGPEFLFLYHPALGPLYEIIRTKLICGELSLGSELILQIANFRAHNLHVAGSLQIIAEHPMGCLDEQGLLHYSEKTGRCFLENVTIENQGVDWSRSEPFWKMNLNRKESVKIVLKGQSTFIAKNLHLKGSHTFVVEEGQTLTLS